MQIPPSVRIGAAIVIEMQSQEGTRQLKSRIEDIGDGLLAIAMPSERGQLITIPTGEYVTLNITTATSANLFVEGEVVGRKAQPIPMLVVRPMSIETHQQRNFHRVQARIEPHAVWWWTGEGDPDASGIVPGRGGAGAAGQNGWVKLDALIVDISGGGLGLLTDCEIPANSLLQMRFPLLTGGDQIEVRGRVVASRPRPGHGGTRYHTGVRFEDLSRSDQERLVKANHLYQIEQRRRALGYDR